VRAVEVTRTQAIEILEDGHRRVAELLGRLSEDALVERGTMGGGEWSAKDLAGHLASWEEIALRSLEDWRRGERPWIESVFDERGAVDRLNAENVEAWLAAPAAAALARFEQEHLDVTDAIATATDEEWSSPAPYETSEPRSLGGLLGGILGAPDREFGHAYAHLQDLQVYVDASVTNA
jgi:hypothetical protein